MSADGDVHAVWSARRAAEVAHAVRVILVGLNASGTNDVVVRSEWLAAVDAAVSGRVVWEHGGVAVAHPEGESNTRRSVSSKEEKLSVRDMNLLLYGEVDELTSLGQCVLALDVSNRGEGPASADRALVLHPRHRAVLSPVP